MTHLKTLPHTLTRTRVLVLSTFTALSLGMSSLAFATEPATTTAAPQAPEAPSQTMIQEAQAGDAKAQLALGSFYYEHRQDKDAYTWFKAAAEQGNVDAQYNLGMLYAKGEGVARDDKAAFEWWLKAAQQGDVEAQLDVASMYQHGEGTKLDMKEAEKWLRKAADQNDRRGQFQLGVSLYTGYAGESNYPEAAKMFKLAADQGLKDAAYNLGSMYHLGEGVKEDWNQALAYYKQACDAQHEPACDAVKRLELQMKMKAEEAKKAK